MVQLITCYLESLVWFYRISTIVGYLIPNPFYKCILNICGAFSKFPDIFVQAFKTVVHSWKFTMLLLYILWDDSPIFMSSGSNEQLQQQLEYTLLNPVYHSWSISKMQSDTLEERYAIRLCFKLGKNATKTYGMLQTAFGASSINRASVFEWHKRFKEGTESVRGDERCGRSKEVNTPELISQRVRVGVWVTMLRSLGSSGRDSVGRGKHSSNRVSGIFLCCCQV